jgi:hypothetical protein
MSEEPSSDSGKQSISPEKIENEILQLFDDEILRADDFDSTPKEVAKEVRSQAATYNRVVRPASILSSKIFVSGAKSMAQHFEIDESIDAPTEDDEELTDEFERLTSEDSDVIRSAEEIMGQLVTLYCKSEMIDEDEDTVSFLDIHRDIRDVCPNTAQLYSHTTDVLARAGALSELKPDK